MNYWFHPDAESEFNQAIDYYEGIEPDLAMILPLRYMQHFNARLLIRTHGLFWKVIPALPGQAFPVRCFVFD